MSNIGEYQNKIRWVVAHYKSMHKEDYDAVCKIVADKKRGIRLAGEKWIEMKGDTMDRALLEYSEVLWGMFNSRLEADEITWLTSKPGARWFGKAYPEFCIAEKI